MEEKLEELGLSRNEAKIFLFLLKNGECTSGPIIKETRIANSRVYESLNSLISRGLVTFNVQKKGKYFQAVEPGKFLELEDERKKKIQALIPELSQLQGNEQKETKVAVYEGFEGFKTAFKKMVDDCPVKGVINIIGFSEQTYAIESLRIFLKNINLRSLEKKQKLRILLDLDVKKTFGLDRETEKITEVRYMPKGFISPAAMDLVEDSVYLILWEEKPFVFMIKNKRIAESFKHYFEFLWKMAKK